ncbi:MAG: Chemotaxis protein PomA [Phycisphaerae bacterium]|nr:Chemotaxis protein PomA [Phycisphaerae bacterium]
MDIASLLGLAVGLGCLGFVFYEVSHGHFSMFYSQEGVLMVFGGSVSVCFMAMPLDKVLSVPGYIKRFMFSKASAATDVIKLMTGLAEKARRDGILTLESELANIKDPFLVSGMRMAIDGQTSDTIESTLRLEILAMQERHKAGKKFFDLIKLYGPGYGLVGTLVGQVGMFGQLAEADIGKMGHALAVAVVATMYGAIVANAIAGPIGDKLALRSGEEIVNREMMLQGLLSIQAGDSPRITLEKMAAFLPFPRREKLKASVNG